MPAIYATLEEIARKLGARPEGGAPKAAHVSIEDLVVCYTTGQGTFSLDKKKKYLSVQGQIFKLSGEPDGNWAGEHEIIIPLGEAWQTPPPPPGPFNRPVPPVPEPPAQAYTKGTWTFGDGSSLTAVGQALVHAAKIQTGESNLWIAADQLISYGTGRYEGAQGLKTAAISILIPEGVSLEEVKEVTVKSLDVFRIARREFIGAIPKQP